MLDRSDDVGIYDIPQHAVRAFERLSGLEVTIHDLRGRLWPFVGPEHFEHRSFFCKALKARDDNQWCYEFDVYRIHDYVRIHGSGGVKYCHGGLLEWFTPLPLDDTEPAILFAGPKVATGRVPSGALCDENTSACDWKTDSTPDVELVTLDSCVLEALRSIACRLHMWYQDYLQQGQAGAGVPRGARARRDLIRGLVAHRHTSDLHVRDLAATLNLSESRTAHLVQEEMGASFGELVTEARIRTAAGLLRHSYMTVVEVAQRSGFPDVSHFHRVFKRRMNVTPQQYRTLSAAREPDPRPRRYSMATVRSPRNPRGLS